MLFTVEHSPNIGDSATTTSNVTNLDEFTTSGNTLIQLHNFFENHTFDTAGPYSDLFSVLLSCSKHLVDTNLHHHTILSNQKRELSRLSSETEALCDLMARCQEGIRELKSSYFNSPQFVERRSQSSARSIPEVTAPTTTEVVNNTNLEIIQTRLEEVEKRLHISQDNINNLRQRQEEFNRQQMKEQNQHQTATDQVQKLEEDLEKLKRGISVHAEYVEEELTAIKSLAHTTTSPSLSNEQISSLQNYTDQKVESLRSELCTALQEATLSGEEAPAGDLLAGLRRLLPRESQSQSQSRLDEMESRLETLEVYAPHHCAMAARPPLLGVELRDEQGIGVRVGKVFHGFPGEAAGITAGDIIIAVNTQEVLTRAEMYAVMVELAREHQSRCRILKQLYFKNYAGQGRGGKEDIIMASKQPKVSSENDSCWELPKLEFKFHLKRGNLIREAVIIVDGDD